MNFQAAAAGELGRLLFALPEPIVRRLGGTRPDHASELTPHSWLLGKLSAATDRPRDAVPLDALRAGFETQVEHIGDRTRLAVDTRDLTVGGVPGRLYTPGGATEPTPLIVYFHGGGWVVGSIRSHDRGCRWLSYLSGMRVLSVEYRKAPERPFPVAIDDARAAYDEVVADPSAFGALPGRIGVAGDSAGGNLAAIVSLEADVTPSFQLLIYPACDLSRDHPSVDTFAEGFLLTKDNMTFYKDRYVPDVAQRTDPRVSPLLAPDLSAAPPAYIGVSVADPLHDEGLAYGERLREAGVHVEVERHPLLHGFFCMTSSRECLAGLARIASAARVLDATATR
jgi:acetyl esterase